MALSDSVVSACIAAFVAAGGWYAAAKQNYNFQRRLEMEREARQAAGLRRIVTADIRVIAIRLEPWLYSFATIRLDDLLMPFKTLESYLRDKDFVRTLSNEQHEALLSLFDRFGRDLAYQQHLFSERESNPTNSLDDFRNRTAANFSSTLLPLLIAGRTLNDSTVMEAAQRLIHAANSQCSTNEYMQQIFIPPEDNES